MADNKYCSTCFKTGEELDAALQKALRCDDNAARAEAAADRAEAAAEGAQSDWNQNDSTLADYVKNRPFYSQLLLPDISVDATPMPGLPVFLPSNFQQIAKGYGLRLEVDREYAVIYDGVVHSCRSFICTYSAGVEVVTIGDPELLVLASPTSELNIPDGAGGDVPFVVWDNGSNVGMYCREAGTHTITISDIVKLPNEYLDVEYINKVAGGAQSDWNQNDSDAPDYVKNRPIYIGGTETVVEHTVVSASEDGDEAISAELSVRVPLVVGNVCRVMFDGTAYECAAQHPYTSDESGDADILSERYVVLGSPDHTAMSMPGYYWPENNEPFAIVKYPNGTYCLYVSVEGAHEVEVTRGGSGVVIEPEYKEAIKEAAGGVQSDWNQNDETKPDYVKNRPFYEADEAETVVESTVTFAHDDGESIHGSLPANAPLVVGSTYRVMFNDEEYECVAYHPQEEGEGGRVLADYIVIGNSVHLSDVPSIATMGNGEPFAIVQYADDLSLYVSVEDDYGVEVIGKGETVVIKPEYKEAIKKSFPTIEMTATLEDGTKQTFKLYGEAVSE